MKVMDGQQLMDFMELIEDRHAHNHHQPTACKKLV